jgi:hypothetical protein
VNSNRIFGLATILIVGAVLVLGWVLGVSPLLAQAATADEQRMEVELTNLTETAKLTQMKAQYDRLDEIEHELAQLRISMPAEVDLDFVYGLLSGIQSGTGASVNSIQTGEALPYGAATGSEVATAVAAPTVPAPSGFYTVPITITFDKVPTDRVMAYASAMQNGPRLFLVTSVTADGAESSSITAFMFVMHDPTAPRGAAELALAGLLPVPKESEKAVTTPEPTPTTTPIPGETGAPTPTPTPTP